MRSTEKPLGNGERLHPWDVSIDQARRIQRHLAPLVCLRPPETKLTSVAGVDVQVRAGFVTAAVVVLDYPSLSTITEAISRRHVAFPYVPGLLSFREGPAILDAFGKLPFKPQLVIFDGQGRAHPRRFGLASHLGIWLDLPTIGCAKSRLCGVHRDPLPGKGSWEPLVDCGETVGAVLRTRTRVKPVFVSPGHRMDLQTAITYLLGCCTLYRLPETTRKADRLARALA